MENVLDFITILRCSFVYFVRLIKVTLYFEKKSQKKIIDPLGFMGLEKYALAGAIQDWTDVRF